jgi:hypothetical protein
VMFLAAALWAAAFLSDGDFAANLMLYNHRTRWEAKHLHLFHSLTETLDQLQRDSVLCSPPLLAPHNA